MNDSGFRVQGLGGLPNIVTFGVSMLTCRLYWEHIGVLLKIEPLFGLTYDYISYSIQLF